MNKFSKIAVGAGALVAGGAASAAALDTTAITGALTDAGTAAGVVGAAYLVVIVGIKALKLIRQAL